MKGFRFDGWGAREADDGRGICLPGEGGGRGRGSAIRAGGQPGHELRTPAARTAAGAYDDHGGAAPAGRGGDDWALRDSRRAQAARSLEGARTHAGSGGGRAGRLGGRPQAASACRQCAAAHPDRARRGASGGVPGRGGQAVPANRGAFVRSQTGLGRASAQARPRARPRGMRGARYGRDRPRARGGAGHSRTRIPGRRARGHRGPPPSRPARARVGSRVSDRRRHFTQAPPQ
jgi:hypothetical protein